MTYAEQIRQLQTQYELSMNKAARLGLNKAGLACYLEAAMAQEQLSRITEGEPSVRHKEEVRRLFSLVRDSMAELGIAMDDVKEVSADQPATTQNSASRSTASKAPTGTATAAPATKPEPGLENFNVNDFRIVEAPKESFEDLVGMNDSIKDVQSFLEERRLYKDYPNLASQMPESSAHALLYGPPGTGKTFFCRTIANHVLTKYSDGAFFSIQPSDILDKYVGVAQKKLAAVFDEMKKYEFPVLVIDEIEALCPSRSGDQSESTKQLVTTFLQQINGVSGNTNAMIIGCSNFPWKIDPAMLSRLYHPIYVDLPSQEAIEQYVMGRAGKYLGTDEETRRSMTEHAVARLEHASFRNLSSLVDDISKLAFRKTIDANPGKKDISEFVPLTLEELDSMLDKVTIVYDPVYIAKLKDTSSWRTDDV